MKSINNFFFAERNIGSRKAGFFEGCIRFPSSFPPEAVKKELLRAFATFLPLYPEGEFEVSVTANAVLQSQRESSFSLFYGLDYEPEDRPRNSPLAVLKLHKVDNLSDVADLPTSFPVEDFDRAFRESLPDTTVFVKEIVNLVYIIRRFHKDLGGGGGDFTEETTTSQQRKKGRFVKV